MSPKKVVCCLYLYLGHVWETETMCIPLITISMERLVDFLDNANGKQ